MARGTKRAVVEAGPVERPWELPEGWRWERLGDIVAKSSGKHQPNPSSSLPFVGLEHIPPRELRLNGVGRFSEMRSAASAFERGDVLYGRLRPYLNKVWLAEFAGAASGELLVLKPVGVLGGYLALALHHARFVAFASHAVTGDRPRLDFNEMAGFQVPVPPLDEQHRLVARVEELFAEIDEGEQALADAKDALANYRRSLLKAVTTGRVEEGETPQVEALSDDLPPLPQGWAWVCLGEIAAVSGGLTKNAKRSRLSMTVPYLRVANVYAARLDLDLIEHIGVTEAELARTLLRRGDLLIVEGNGSIEQIGRSAVWDGSIEPCAHQNHLIKVRFAHPALADWVQSWLQSPHGRRELEQLASSTSGLHTLSVSKVRRLRCPLPPDRELKGRIAHLADLNALKREAEASLNWATTAPAILRQSILAAAFRGDLVA